MSLSRSPNRRPDRGRARRPGPGGVGDGLPALRDGEPVLARWFALAMVALVLAGLVVTGWAFASIRGTTLGPAERRPPGSATVTHERGAADLNRIRTTEPGPGCAEGVTLIGDESARAALRRGLGAACQLLRQEAFAPAATGLQRWADERGLLRVGVFELNGVESSARLEDGQLVIEVNAKFQFEPGARAAPAIIHELTHLGDGMPGQPVSAQAELAAARAQAAACEALVLGSDPPRGCTDAEELLASEDPLADLRAAGYPQANEGAG